MTQWIELRRSSWRKNISFLRSIEQNWQLWPCVKANAYGHGIIPISECIDDLVDGYCVVSTTEALQLRAKTEKPILVLNIVEREDIDSCAKKSIILPLASQEQREWYSHAQVLLSVHVEIDTGMARTGFRWKKTEEMKHFLEELPSHISVDGFFSHYAAAGENDDYTYHQLEKFLPFATEMVSLFPHKKLIIHMDKSASLLMRHKIAEASPINAARPGFALYGVDPQWNLVDALQPVLTWKTKILSVRTLHKGEAVGYGLTFMAQKDTSIATLPIGYADGYDRSLSNKSEVLVRGMRCPVRGRICMNLTMIEVPSTVQVGDEVVLIGTQGGDEISAHELAQHAQTSAYEILTRLHPTIQRRIVS